MINVLRPGDESATTDELLQVLYDLYCVTGLCTGVTRYLAAREAAKQSLESWGVTVK